jgi:hypothetical protein
MDFLTDNVEFIKNGFYITGGIITIIVFIRSFRKTDNCVFTYRTEMGNESRPMLISIQGDMYKIKVLDNGKSRYVHKLPASFRFSDIRRNEYNESDFDESAFFACLKEGEALLIKNEDLSSSMKIEYEDQFRNRYFQTFKLLKDQIGNPQRFDNNKSQSLYKLSKRKQKYLFVWL